jgi:hypothetical protein
MIEAHELVPDDPDDVVRAGEAAEEERVRRIKAAGRQIVKSFNELRRELGHEQAWSYLAWFLKQVKPPRKPKGKHRPQIDEDILAAHDEAPKGKKMAAVSAVGRQYGISPEATERRLRRLRAEEKQSAEAWTKFLERLPPLEVASDQATTITWHLSTEGDKSLSGILSPDKSR